MVLHIIWMIVLGLVVGLIARAVVPGRQPMGFIATAVLGIVGAYVGGHWAASCSRRTSSTSTHRSSMVPGRGGAVLLLWTFKLVTSRTRTL